MKPVNQNKSKVRYLLKKALGRVSPIKRIGSFVAEASSPKVTVKLGLGCFSHLSPWLLQAKMSTLRRRFLGDTSSSSTEPSREPSPAKGEPVALVSKSHLKELKGKRSKRWQLSIFVLGGLFGLVVAAIFANQHDVINLEGLVDFNMESLLDVIPAGIVNEAKDITVCLLSLCKIFGR